MDEDHLLGTPERGRFPYHMRINVPKDIWAFVMNRNDKEYRKITKNKKISINVTDNGVEGICDIETFAKTKSCLKNTIKALHKQTNGIIIRKYKGVSMNESWRSQYRYVKFNEIGEDILVVGPEQDVTEIDGQINNPMRRHFLTYSSNTNPASLRTPVRATSNLYSAAGERHPTTHGIVGKVGPHLPPVTFLLERGQRIHVQRDDITKMSVDIIVNAANEHLRHEGGVALAISRAAGPELQRECDQYTQGYGYLHVTQVTVTKGYNLPARHVIHVVGPRWQETSRRECSENLYVAIMNCLNLATRLNVSSIAIPAISSGIFGVPPQLVSEQMCRAVLDFCRTESSITDIYLVDINPEIPELTSRQLQKLGVKFETRRPKSQYDTQGSSVTLPLANGFGDSASASTNLGKAAEITMARKSESSNFMIMAGLSNGMTASGDVGHNTRVSNGRESFQDNMENKRSTADLENVTRHYPGALNNATDRNTTNGYPDPYTASATQRSSSATLHPRTFLVERGQRIHVQRENITKMRVDVIVNASNEHLKLNGGVALAISRAAGPKLQQKCDQFITNNGTLKVTKVAVTRGYNLPANYVIHVVGPRWNKDYRSSCCEALYAALSNCLYQAKELQVCSIAIPAISTGTNGIPRELVTEQMCRAVLDFCSTESFITDIYLVDINPEIPELIARQLQNNANLINMETRSRKARNSQHRTSASQASTSGYGGSEPSLRDHPGPTPSFKHDSTDHTRYSRPPKRARKLVSAVTECVICTGTLTSPKRLPCGHVFCKYCIDQWMQEKPTCPCCGKVYGTMTGNQPDGTMNYRVIDCSLPGYEGYRTIEIVYNFPAGYQQSNHPNPGHSYTGIGRRAYLPDSPEGREVLALLRKAFDARLLFTIGRSVTTGRDDQITWNDVHQKTSMTGGPDRFGYPDPTYLQRVKEELAAKGIQTSLETSI